MSKKEVAKRGDTAVAAAYDYGEMAGAGFEDVTKDDLSIPFLAVLQSNSPQVEDKEPEGAEAGMLFNTVTKELLDSVVVVPVHMDQCYVEWVPRNKGGGFVGLHEPGSPVVEEAIKENGDNRFGKLPYGDNELIETHYVYCLLVDEDGATTNGFAVISFTSTKIKPRRDWFSAIYMLKGKPPLFASRAVIKTVRQKNDHGTFHNVVINPFGGGNWRDSLIDPNDPAGKALLDEAVSFRDMVTSGAARADHGSERSAEGEGAPAGGKGADGEPVPF